MSDHDPGPGPRSGTSPTSDDPYVEPSAAVETEWFGQKVAHDQEVVDAMLDEGIDPEDIALADDRSETEGAGEAG